MFNYLLTLFCFLSWEGTAGMTVDIGDHEVNRIAMNDMKPPRFNKDVAKRKDLLDHFKKMWGI